MIFHMLCLFLMMMLVNSVISAPGILDSTEDVSRARKDKPRGKSSGTLDSLGGGNILRLDSPDIQTQNFRSLEMLVDYQMNPTGEVLRARKDKPRPKSAGTLDSIGGGNIVRLDHPDIQMQNFRSLEMFVDYQDDVPQNMALVVQEDKQKPSSSGTLDSIGGGNLIKVTDSDVGSEILRSLHSFLENQNVMLHNMVSLARDEKQKQSSSGTLDSIGGGHLLGLLDSNAEADAITALNLLLDNQNDIRRNMILVAREDKQKPSSSGTLDSIGGGNLVRIIDPEAETEFFNSLASFYDKKEETVREDNPTPKPASSGTLDPLGGGNLVRVTDSDGGERTFRSVESFVDDQGRQNMMRLAREDKSIQRSSHALDGTGAGRIAGVTDPYRGQMLRSLDHTHLVDSLDQGGDVLRMLDSISGTDLLNSLDSQGVMAVLSALRKAQTKRMLDPKRMLDSVSGWTFGESKRNFDEIDNVGFTSFAKRNPYYAKQLALAKKNFDEIDRAGFETYNKRDFDEIDRAGFETFEKRDRKE